MRVITTANRILWANVLVCYLWSLFDKGHLVFVTCLPHLCHMTPGSTPGLQTCRRPTYPRCCQDLSFVLLAAQRKIQETAPGEESRSTEASQSLREARLGCFKAVCRVEG